MNQTYSMDEYIDSPNSKIRLDLFTYNQTLSLNYDSANVNFN